MDFFQAQEQARKSTRWLVFWFALCVLGVIAAVYLVVQFVFRPAMLDGASHLWDPQVLVMVAVVTGGIIVFGSLFKLLQLSAGGAVVARDLGGRQLDPSTTEPLERRLINVVEEMSIASGLPAPEVWILDQEEGINAFAAGTDPSNAVVGVTRGCLERLTREELQGVVAHEFSHILNGDMRLNMRLVGWVFGLIMIALIGRGLIEMLRHARVGSSRGSRDNGGAIILALLVVGISLWVVGSIGSFFARALQAAVSRQREFLADASAVQFTRNPDGISKALQKVGGFREHGRIHAAKAQEARHMFFVKSDLMSLSLATHPPLEDRIRRIDSAFDGEIAPLASQPSAPRRPGSRRAVAAASGLHGSAPPPSFPPPIPAAAMASLGESGRLDPNVGREVREHVAAQSGRVTCKDEARGLIFGLLLPSPGAERQRALELLGQQGDAETADRAERWERELAELPTAEKLAVVDLSVPWLRRMSQPEGRRFIDTTRDLVAVDGRVSPFEFMLQKVVERHVAIGLGIRQPRPMRHRSLAELSQPCAVMVGAFAAISGDESAFEAAEREFAQHTRGKLPRLAAAACGLAEVGAALDKFEAATPLVKSQLLRLCGLVASHDGVIEDAEVELLRATAEAIGAPIPPLGRGAGA